MKNKNKKNKREIDLDCTHKGEDGFTCTDCMSAWYKWQLEMACDKVLDLEEINYRYEQTIQQQGDLINELKKRVQTKHGF